VVVGADIEGEENGLFFPSRSASVTAAHQLATRASTPSSIGIWSQSEIVYISSFVLYMYQDDHPSLYEVKRLYILFNLLIEIR
jgi:hypothetical protein